MALLLVTLSLGFYNVGTIWAHEVDIFRSWRLAGNDFATVQRVHWRKLPYWVFVPLGAWLACSIAVVWMHPADVATAPLAVACGLQVLSLVLTALFWGRWQAELARDPLGACSPYLAAILRTHWVRTGLITASAAVLLATLVAFEP